MTLKELKKIIDKLIIEMGEDCYVETCLGESLDIYEVRGQLITTIELDN